MPANPLAVPTIVDPTAINLQIISAQAPSSARIGEVISVRWQAKNGGLAAINANWYDGIFLSSDDKYDADDAFIFSFLRYGQELLAPGESYASNGDISIPGIGKAGVYYLLFYGDVGESLEESNRGDNVFALPIRLDLNGPDLKLVAATAPSAARFGDIINVSWTVSNVGGAAARSDWADVITLSRDTYIDESDAWLTGFSPPGSSPLEVGESYTIRRDIQLPGVGLTGLYYLLFNANLYLG